MSYIATSEQYDGKHPEVDSAHLTNDREESGADWWKLEVKSAHSPDDPEETGAHSWKLEINSAAHYSADHHETGSHWRHVVVVQTLILSSHQHTALIEK